MFNISEQIKTKAGKIKLLLTDVDGVLTNGTLLYGINGEEIKQFHVRDGLAVKLLEKSGIKVGIITGRDSIGLRNRVSDLKINITEYGIEEKLSIFNTIIKKLGLSSDEVAYIGDDLQDLSVLQTVGLSACVGDSESYIKQNVDIVLARNGGQAAFREFADIILHCQGKLSSVISLYALSEQEKINI